MCEHATEWLACFARKRLLTLIHQILYNT